MTVHDIPRGDAVRPDRNAVMAIISAHDGVTLRGIAVCWDRMAGRNLPPPERLVAALKNIYNPARHLPTMTAVYTVCCRLENEGAVRRDMAGRWHPVAGGRRMTG